MNKDKVNIYIYKKEKTVYLSNQMATQLKGKKLHDETGSEYIYI